MYFHALFILQIADIHFTKGTKKVYANNKYFLSKNQLKPKGYASVQPFSSSKSNFCLQEIGGEN